MERYGNPSSNSGCSKKFCSGIVGDIIHHAAHVHLNVDSDGGEMKRSDKRKESEPQTYMREDLFPPSASTEPYIDLRGKKRTWPPQGHMALNCHYCVYDGGTQFCRLHGAKYMYLTDDSRMVPV